MRCTARVVASCLVAALALLVLSAPAAAAPKPITGKLSKRGYSVIALAASGKAKSVRARTGRFRLVPPAANVSLHLRTANGRYAGPVVIGGTGSPASISLSRPVSILAFLVRRC